MADKSAPKTEPVMLHDGASDGLFLIYNKDSGPRIDIRYEGETLWMSQAQITELFKVSKKTISEHIANIFSDGELDEQATVRKFRTVQTEGTRQVEREINHYNLDAIISVGYRVNSKQGTIFRRWATDRLVQFATRGFVIDKQRLKQPDSSDRISELREIIREIRSDEANVYRELRSICAMCQDHDGNSKTWRDFYQHMQAKLMWAVTSKTPAEIISDRSDATQENMGLRTWAHDNIRKSDVIVSKNYLAEAEAQELNRLTTILLDIFEDQLDIGRLVMMADAEALLDQNLRNLNRAILRGGGKIASTKAKQVAEAHYALFNQERKRVRHKEADEQITALKKAEKQLPKTSKKRR